MPKTAPVITIGELRERLDGIPEHYTIDFGGLTFYRIKQRSPTHYQVEFGQTVFLDDAGNVVVDNH